MEEKVHTKHPQGKSGRSIGKKKYDTVKTAIIAALQNRQLTHSELVAQLEDDLRKSFPENISWYTMTVKLDLEARGIIERTTSRPQRYRVK